MGRHVSVEIQETEKETQYIKPVTHMKAVSLQLPEQTVLTPRLFDGGRSRVGSP